MRKWEVEKYRIDKTVGLIRLGLILGVLCFLVLKVPGQATQLIITLCTLCAFSVGDSKLLSKLKL
jgi:hypothetical protein